MSLPERTLSYREAVLEALFSEMRASPHVVMIGEDIGAAGGVFQQSKGLFEEFGASRIIDTPISEPGSFGMAVGAAMTGLRPVFEVMFNDFITLILDQLMNQAAKIHYLSDGAYSVPLVVRTTMGTGSFLGAQHSQSLYALPAHIPGLKVVVPAFPDDAKGLMAAAVRDDNPVLFFEDRLLYNRTGPVPEGDYFCPLGKATVRRLGRDVTVVGIGRMVHVALDAAEELAQEGIEVEVIDVRSLVPLDVETIADSVRKTNRALVVDGGHRQFGASSEIAMQICEHAFDWLDAPVERLAGADVPIPLATNLEPLTQPGRAAIVSSVRQMVGNR